MSAAGVVCVCVCVCVCVVCVRVGVRVRVSEENMGKIKRREQPRSQEQACFLLPLRNLGEDMSRTRAGWVADPQGDFILHP
jgi:hypothetical protein